jgi:hypothetical protein
MYKTEIKKQLRAAYNGLKIVNKLNNENSRVEHKERIIDRIRKLRKLISTIA